MKNSTWTRRILSMMLALVLLFPAKASAASVVASGSCGDNAKWTIDNAGVLTIRGTGSIEDYNTEWGEKRQPWNPRDTNVDVKQIVVENGITRIGNEAFGCNW